MRARTLILLVVALVLAGGTTMMARVWLASQRAAKQEAAPIAVPTPAKSVLIARSPIERGQILKPADFTWEQWPESGIDKNYILLGTRTPETYSGWVAKQPIAAGEPVTEAEIISPGNRGFLAAALRPGMRAVSVPVNVTSGISGFVLPGDRVDLIVTYSVQDRPVPGQQSGPLLDHKISETVLRDIRVIAIDQKLDSKPGEATVAKTATFEVTPKQSEVIALANEMGKISLSLRSLVPDPDGPDGLKQEVADKVPASPAPSPASSPLSDPSSSSDSSSSSASSPSSTSSSTEAFGSPGSETYTVDSDISPLLHSPGGVHGDGSLDDGRITILRGGQSTATSVVQQQ
ncbi:MAG TPA: Flp pilus assembly protein CpaB [Stellaceae bacterium]|nr:Flp pilus assembly protein CpaB [Stellaceae bacterium]